MKLKLLATCIGFLIANDADARLDDATSIALFDQLKAKSVAVQGVQLDLDRLHRIEDVAERSALKTWCGVDWQPAFLRFMQDERRAYQLDANAAAATAQYHGLVQELLAGDLRRTGACPSARRDSLEP